MAEARARLEKHRTPHGTSQIQRLKAEHGLSEQAELSLQLLPPAQLQELLAGGAELRRKLKASANRSQIVLSLVSMLDPSVPRLVSSLRYLDKSQGATQQAGTDDLFAEANRRLAANKSAPPAVTAGVERLIKAAGLGEGTAPELALRLLAPPQLRELLAGETDVRKKLFHSKDKGKVLLSLVKLLDPEVERLVHQLQDIDDAAEATGSGQAAPAGSGVLVAEAQRRMAANESKLSIAAIERFKNEFDLADQVELALRMLKPSDLRNFLAGGVAMRRQVAQAADKNQFVLSSITKLDPGVMRLVKGLMEADQGGGTGGDADPLVKEAKRRLQFTQSGANAAAVQKVKAEYKLGDRAELALRLMAPPQLHKLLSPKNELWKKMSGKPDTDRAMMWLISQADSSIEKMVAKLSDKGRGTGGAASQSGVPPQPAQQAAQGRRAELQAEARRRLQSHTARNFKGKAAVFRLKSEFKFKDDTVLALRLLPEAQFEELIAGEDDLRTKLNSVSDKDKVLLSLISMLDPEVEALVRAAKGKDHQGPKPTPVGPIRPVSTGASGTKVKGKVVPPKAKSAAAASKGSGGVIVPPKSKGSSKGSWDEAGGSWNASTGSGNAADSGGDAAGSRGWKSWKSRLWGRSSSSQEEGKWKWGGSKESKDQAGGADAKEEGKKKGKKRKAERWGQSDWEQKDGKAGANATEAQWEPSKKWREEKQWKPHADERWTQEEWPSRGPWGNHG